MSLTQTLLRELENVKSGKPSLFLPVETSGVYVWRNPLRVARQFAITRIVLRLDFLGHWGSSKFYISYLPDPPYSQAEHTMEFTVGYMQSNLLPAYNDVPIDVVARDLSWSIAGALRFTIQDSLENTEL